MSDAGKRSTQHVRIIIWWFGASAAALAAFALVTAFVWFQEGNYTVGLVHLVFVFLFNAIARRAFKAYHDYELMSFEDSLEPASVCLKRNGGAIKRALVLCGGGGKGAYQVGCLRAFEEKGIKFSLVSGSSIGALNGALFLAHGIDKLRHLWTSTTGNVFTLKWSGILVAMLRWLSFRGSRFPYSPTGRLHVTKRRRMRVIFGYCLILTGGLIITFGDLLPRGNFLLGSLAFFWLVVMFPDLAAQVIWLLCEQFNLTIFSRRRLVQLLEEHLDETCLKRCGGRLLIALSREAELFDPVRPTHDSWSRASPALTFVPEYLDVTKEPKEKLTQYLLASASLPFGILGPIKIGEATYVDGGVTDNAPVLPALEQGFNEIYVVHTNNRGIANGVTITTKSGLLSRLGELRRLRKLTRLNSEKLAREYQSKYRDKIKWGFFPSDRGYVSLGSIRRIKARIIHIVPSQSTGSLITSILFRHCKYTEHLIQNGYQDTLAGIAANVANETLQPMPRRWHG